MSYPSEYEECKAFLEQYRRELLEKLILGRLRALASEYRATLQRYLQYVRNIPIDFTVKEAIQRYYLVGIIYNKSIQGFGSASVKLSYVGRTSTYPKEEPVGPVMTLPSVPMMVYEPLKDWQLQEKITEAMHKVWAIIRAPSGTFSEIPDFENYAYDYYYMDALEPEVGEFEVYNPTPIYVDNRFAMIVKVKGQSMPLRRVLHRKSDGQEFTIKVRVFLDAVAIFDDETQQPYAILIETTCEPHPGSHLCDVVVLRRIIRIPEDLGVWEAVHFQNRIFGVRRAGSRLITV